MKAIVALVLASVTSSVSAAASNRGNAFLSNGMNPGAVAKTLAHVAEEWKAEAHVFAECMAAQALNTDIIEKDCKSAGNAFAKSCGKVSMAIVGASLGDVANVKEYMTDVCSQKTLSSWHANTCLSLKNAITGRMTSNNFDNRENFQTFEACGGLWSRIVGEQKAVREAEIAKEKAENQKEAEEAAEESKKAAQKFEAAKQEKAEAEKIAKAREIVEAEEAKKRLAQAKNQVVQSMDEQKAQISFEMPGAINLIKHAGAMATDSMEMVKNRLANSKDQLAAAKADAMDAKKDLPASTLRVVDQMEQNKEAAKAVQAALSK